MSEVEQIGFFFIGIGIMVIFFAVAYLFYQISRIYQIHNDREDDYSVFECASLDKIAKKIGIDVNEHIAKCKINNSKNFRRALEEKMVNELINKKNKEDKKE